MNSQNPFGYGGLSPRGRGKLDAPGAETKYLGSIPAWAGETLALLRFLCQLAVYPRVGGGNSARACISTIRSGLSPRGRGKPNDVVKPQMAWRSIPAWAGETHLAAQGFRRLAVYPRVGGGNLPCANSWTSSAGLSPRGRGKQRAISALDPVQRSIPAWAGETEARAAACQAWAVYPRVGGGNAASRFIQRLLIGLSPRGRGKLLQALDRHNIGRSIPAWAGETMPAATNL